MDDPQDGPAGDGDDGLVITLESVEEGIAVVLEGDVDAATVERLRRVLRALQLGFGEVRLVLRAVRSVDAAGIGALAEAQQTMGDRLVLVAPTPPVLQVLEAARLTETTRIVAE
jgi:anti-anti-sigma factor